MEPIKKTILGRVLPTNRESWLVGVQYKLLDVVAHAPTGGIYLCVAAHTSQATFEPSKWGILCGKGVMGTVPTYTFSEDGAALSIENPDGSMSEEVNIRGDQGDQGEQGEQGSAGAAGSQGPQGSDGAIKLDGIARNEGDWLTITNPDGSRGNRVYTRGENRG